jgi:probable HAF family extracellular repeat protein
MSAYRVLAILILSCGASIAAAGQFIDLGPLGGTTSQVGTPAVSGATPIPFLPGGLNDSGLVVGRGETSTPGTYHAAIWKAPAYTPQDLGVKTTDGSGNSVASAVNSLGVVVGTTATDSGTAAFRYTNGTMTLLPNAGPQNAGAAYCINAAGIVGGFSTDPNGQSAVLWDANNNYTDLRTALVGIGAGTYPERITGINATEAIGQFGIGANTVWSFTCNLTTHALALIPRYAGGQSIYATAVNGSNVIVGYGTNPNDSNHLDAVRYDATGGTTLLPAPAGTWITTRAMAINNGGDVVGWASTTNSPETAILWKGGQAHDLNTLYASSIPAGWILQAATAINTGGAIAGYGLDAAGETHAFLLAAPLLPGDADGNGVVDIADLSIILTNFDKSGMGWSQGDFDGNGAVDIADLSNLLTNFDKTAAAGAGLQAVPEPGALALLTAALFGLLACVWRKRQ